MERIKALKRAAKAYMPRDNLDFIFISEKEAERRERSKEYIPYLSVIGVVVWPETRYLKKEERNDFWICYSFFKNIKNERFCWRFGQGDGLRIYERRLHPVELDFHVEEEYVNSLTDLYEIMKKNGITYDFKQYGEILSILNQYLDEFDENIKRKFLKV